MSIGVALAAVSLCIAEQRSRLVLISPRPTRVPRLADVGKHLSLGVRVHEKTKSLTAERLLKTLGPFGRRTGLDIHVRMKRFLMAALLHAGTDWRPLARRGDNQRVRPGRCIRLPRPEETK
jgi:hypothetical protein